MIRTKRRKGIWLGILTLMLSLLCGCESADESRNHYVVRCLNSAAQGDDYFLLWGSEIKQYSLSEQKVVNRYGCGKTIECFAADENYIFFVVEAHSTPRVDGEMWRVERETGEYELIMKTNTICTLTLTEGYLFYGTYGKHGDIYVCPANGNFETDSISLLEQFEDGAAGKLWEETVYQRWRILRRNKDLACVIDIESGEEVYNNLASYTDGVIPVSFWTGEEIVLFFNNKFVYNRLSEDRARAINDLNKMKYWYSALERKHLTMEGEKIVGLIVVAKLGAAPRINLVQYEIKNDLLFEIDLETDTSRIIYSTKNNRTRIIGYKEGMVYLLQDGVIYQETIEGTDREKLLDLQEEGWELSPHMIYFDWHGNHLIIYGYQRTIQKTRIESLEV